MAESKAKKPAAKPAAEAAAVNMRGLKCPLPTLKTRKLLSKMAAGELLAAVGLPLEPWSMPGMVDGSLLEQLRHQPTGARVRHQDDVPGAEQQLGRDVHVGVEGGGVQRRGVQGQ